MTNPRNLYEVLGVSPQASQDDIKKAFRKKAIQFHPDKNPGDKEAEKKFKELNAAHEVLGDPDKRSAYDRMGHDAFHQHQSGGGFSDQGGAGFSDFSSIFEDFFADFTGGRSRGPREPQKGSDVAFDVSLTLEDVFRDKSIDLTIPMWDGCQSCDATGSQSKAKAQSCKECRGQGRVFYQRGFFAQEAECRQCQGAGSVVTDPCSSCKGMGRVRSKKTISVTLPAGVDDGQAVRFSKKGEAGVRGSGAGDLYIKVHLKAHAFFQRQGLDLLCHYPVSMTTAALGGVIEVPIIDGGSVEVTIKEGLQPGETIVVKQKGMAYGVKRGDLQVIADVYVPIQLNDKQKALLKDFSEEEKNKTSRVKTFFQRIKDWVSS